MTRRFTVRHVLAVILVLTLALVTVPSIASGDESTNAPTGLTVNGLTKPADLEDLDSPAFSWRVQTGKQSAYRIVVASSAPKASAHDGDVWDSGKVTSTTQTDIAYTGDTLSTSKRYYVAVQTWDVKDEGSAWSEASWFGTSPGSSWEGSTPIWTRAQTADWTNYTLTAKLTPTSTAIGVRFRAVDGNNSYMWQFRGSDNRLVPHKQTGGGYATLGSAVTLRAGTLAIGKHVAIKIQADGSTLKTWIDDVLVDTRTDSSYGNGVIGFRNGSSESGTVDDVKVVSDTSGETLFENDFSGDNPFGCGTITSGALVVGKSAACIVSGFSSDWAFFRKDVALDDKDVAWATLFATGVDYRSSKQYVYKFKVNGTFVGLGPTAPMSSETRFDGFDVTDLLKKGEANTLSAIAYTSSSSAKLQAQLVVQYDDGSRQVVGSGDDWKAMAGSGVFPTVGSYGSSYFAAPKENFDARKYPFGWEEAAYDDDAWGAAVTKPAISNLQSAPMGKVQEQLHDPVKIVDKGNGDYFVDFGRTWLGGVRYSVANGTAGDNVDVRFGQVPEPANTVKYRTRAGNNYQDIYTLKSGAQTIETWGMRTFRYVEVVGAPEPITKDNLQALALVYPFDESASTFTSSDDNLNQVYQLSKNTIESSNVNFYTDSWERERTNYEADGYLQLQSSLYLMDDLSLGRYSMNFFKTNRTWPTEWPVYIVLAVHDAWRQTGNTEQVSDYYENLKTKLPTAKWFEASSGLIRKTSRSNGCSSSTDCDIVDWPTSQRDGYQFRQYNTVINSITYQALVDMAAMAQAIGKDDEAVDYAAQAKGLRTKINATLYNEEKGAYDDGVDENGELTGHYSVHASAFALAFGIPEGDQAKRVATFVESRGMACSVYCAAFLIKGLYDGDNGQGALDLLTSEEKHSWMNMINLGAGATMEAWDPSEKSNLTYSHPWAASPAFNVPSGLFGIKPIDAGYARFSIKPQPGNLDYATVKVPTVKGSIGVAFDHGRKGDFRMSVSVPGNTTTTVLVPTDEKGDVKLFVDRVPRTLTPVNGFLTVNGVTPGCHILTTEPGGFAWKSERLTSVCTSAPGKGPLR